MTCVVCYEINPFVYEKFIEKNICIRTNGTLNNGLVYLYSTFQFNVINVSTSYTTYSSRIKEGFITYKIHFHFSMRKS